MTPLREQYLRIKKQFPDTIVFFRLGDFYESFDDDAKKVADACNIVLTAREMGTAQRVPLAGVPYHAVETYIARLINAGHKVAIVEQTSDEAINGLMDRQVVRVAEVNRRMVLPRQTPQSFRASFQHSRKESSRSFFYPSRLRLLHCGA